MFPKWEFDVEDTLAENIIKLMFVVKEDSPRPRKKARKEAPAEASEEAAAEASEEAAAEASEEVTTNVGGLTKEDIKTMFKDIADAMREGFGTCLKEIKYLSERVEAVEKKVGITTKWKGTSSQNTTSPPKPTLEPGVILRIRTEKLHLLCFLYCMDFIYSESVNGTNAGRKSLAEDKGPDVPAAVPADASSSKDKAPEPSLKKDARYKEKRGMLLWHFAVQRVIEQGNLLPHSNLLYPGYNPFAPIDKKKLKELADWLKTCLHYRTTLDKKPRKRRTWWKRYNANPQHFRSERMCYLDHLFAQQWRFNFKDFKDSEPGQNGLGRRLPGGVICSSISPEELDVVMEPFLYMVPYLLVEGASSDEQRAQYSLEPFTYERPTNIPLARSGDCGVYTLKYIECHALGIEFSKKRLC
ncbi:unnamed protein product [Brassica oleracea]